MNFFYAYDGLRYGTPLVAGDILVTDLREELDVLHLLDHIITSGCPLHGRCAPRHKFGLIVMDIVVCRYRSFLIIKFEGF